MANFAVLGWYDVFDLATTLKPRLGLFRSTDDVGRKVLHVRFPRQGEDENAESVVWVVNREVTRQKWPELHAMLARMTRDAKARLGTEIELGRVFLEMLDRGGRLDWREETGAYFESYMRALLPLRTNPAMLLIAGAETASPGIGWLTAVAVRQPCAAINMGEMPRVYLIVDSRRKEPAPA